MPGGSDYLHDLAVDRNGGILLAGETQHPNFGYVGAIAKLTPGGRPRPSFRHRGEDLLREQQPHCGDGDHGRAGERNQLPGRYQGDRLEPLDPDLSRSVRPARAALDFEGSGSPEVEVTWTPSTFNEVERVLLPSDRKIVVAGYTAAGVSYAVTRLNPDGTPDPNFGVSGTRLYEPMQNGNPTGAGVAAAALSGGRVVVAGDVASPTSTGS